MSSVPSVAVAPNELPPCWKLFEVVAVAVSTPFTTARPLPAMFVMVLEPMLKELVTRFGSVEVAVSEVAVKYGALIWLLPLSTPARFNTPSIVVSLVA